MNCYQLIILLAITTFCSGHVRGWPSSFDEDESMKREMQIQKRNHDIALFCGDNSIDEPELQNVLMAMLPHYPKTCQRPIMELLRAEKNCKREVKRFGEDPSLLFKLLLKSPECRKDLQEKVYERGYGSDNEIELFLTHNDNFCNVGSAFSEALKGVAMEYAVKQALVLQLDSGNSEWVVFESRRQWGFWFSEPIEKYLAGKELDIQVQEDTEKCVKSIGKQNPLCPFDNSMEMRIGTEYWRQIAGTFTCKSMVFRIKNELRSETEELKRFKEKLCSLETDEDIDETCKLDSLPCTFLSSRHQLPQDRISYLELLRLERMDFCYDFVRSDVTRLRDEYRNSYIFRAIVKGFGGGVQSLFGR